jgi:hypothetical protein
MNDIRALAPPESRIGSRMDRASVFGTNLG